MACPHGGRAVPAASGGGSCGSGSGGAAVQVDGAPVATATDTYLVTGCPHAVAGRPQPCTSVRWDPGGAGREVCVDGVPVLLDTTAGMCFGAGLVPQGPPVVAPGQAGSGARQAVVCG
ncbi:hypothetical protein [Streptomyces sp. NRRL F-4489]|uniref:hypothetical protein n=1 Tax=Streptomyces sp. NRRL F-4489 TaxID=1609095 RepID=UPI002D21C545|nr:hypothetical protein [Streptomyces sp. NRRL F-4489]